MQKYFFKLVHVSCQIQNRASDRTSSPHTFILLIYSKLDLPNYNNMYVSGLSLCII